jgi:UDP-N-acetylglucosamine/UDP-N-acetylgalactosamine diphosphorylase
MAWNAGDQYEQLRASFEGVGQGHVFRFWDVLDSSERGRLLADLSRIPVDTIGDSARFASSAQPPSSPTARIDPPEVIRREEVSADLAARGEALLAEGKVAAFTVAGGQGTRLGFDGPKGAFCISPVRNKPLFQLFAEAIASTDRRYGCRTQWYVMTSPVNHEETAEFFERNSYFGLEPGRVTFFQQGVMPAFDRDGRILLDRKDHIALAPDGHGGSLLALARTGMLADMAERGIDYISYFQVDNPLVMCLDPLFVGLHAANDSEMSSKALPKADDTERVGNFVLCDGKMAVIEYSDFPEELAHARNADGTRKFDAANIAVHLLSRSFVERLTADPAAFGLPWHRAEKKVPFVDLATGDRVEPGEPNAVKLESFVFDALPLAENPILLETSRAEEFSPVKNPTGVDSVETAKRDLNRRAARWLEAAGFKVPRTGDGEPDGSFEISPLRALEPGELKERGPTPQPLEPGTTFYVE